VTGIGNPMIRSFQDYRAFMQNAFTPVQPVEVARFCVWCIERFPPAFGEVVFDGLKSDECTRLVEILAELKDVIGSGDLVSPVLATIVVRSLPVCDSVDVMLSKCTSISPFITSISARAEPR